MLVSKVIETGEKEMSDQFSHYYQDYLDGTYDCVDRIVLNAYVSFGTSPGRFRSMWRRWKGSDEGLDNAHLMRLAGRFARRLRAYAKANGIPVVECEKGERKHKVAEQYVPDDPEFVGVFVILVGRAKAPVWDVQQGKQGQIRNIQRKYAYVKHYFFHIMDPEWGHIIIRMSGHAPWGAQIILNGHNYVARRAHKAGVSYRKEGNCFTEASHIEQLAAIADTLRSEKATGLLRQVCERWIYTACLCFALDTAERERLGVKYQYSVYQAEYSRNLLFEQGVQMEKLVNGVIDRTRPRLDAKRVKTIFGYKRRPWRKQGKPPRFEAVVETPVYDLTIFKIHFGKLTVKLYTKGERVLRSEAIVHNAKALRIKRSLPHFSGIVNKLEQILERFLNALHCVDVTFLPDDILDELGRPGFIGDSRVAGIDLSRPRMRAMMEAVIKLAMVPGGLQVAMIAEKTRALLGWDEQAYLSRHASYDLRKLRAKGWVRKIPGTHKYEVLPKGLKIMTALLVLREKIIKPVLRGAGHSEPKPAPTDLSQIDKQYRIIHGHMQTLFNMVGIAI